MGPFQCEIFYDSILSKNDLGGLPVNDLEEVLHLNSQKRYLNSLFVSLVSPRLCIKLC